MSISFDQFPVYDAVVKNNNKLSDVWSSFFATFHETLSSYLTENGIFIPKVTNEQRSKLINLQDGQMIYNTDAGKFQGYEAGFWKEFTLV